MKTIFAVITIAILMYIITRLLSASTQENEDSAETVQAQTAAQKAKENKEKEIEETDSTVLLNNSAYRHTHSANISTISTEHQERVRARIRQKLQQ